MWNYNYAPYDELYHYGVKGMKWGIRRYQYKKGGLTPEGNRRYSDSEVRNDISKSAKTADRLTTKASYKFNKKKQVYQDRLQSMAAKANTKAYKIKKKSDELIKDMEDTLKDFYINEFDPKVLSKGRNYAHMLFDEDKSKKR